MTIVVETGAGLSTAETYIGVAESLTYHADRGNAAWAALTTAQQEQALRRATEYMMQVYRLRWKGVRMKSTQALDWPRAYVYLEPVITGANLEFPNLVASNIVPVEVARACAELALLSVSGPLLAPLERGVITESIGPISVTYDKFSPESTRRPAVDGMLRPYLDEFSGTLKAIRA